MFSVDKYFSRDASIFNDELEQYHDDLLVACRSASFLVVGGAGSIGQYVVKALLDFAPARICVVDVSENNLAELVRDIRSRSDYSAIDLSFLAIDVGSIEFCAFLSSEAPFDYVLNLSALKHVRSEKDPFTMMRMLKVNVLNTHNMLSLLQDKPVTKFFSVSTDKASSPINMMGASKRLMEYVMYAHSTTQSVSSARFANVAFSDGSLLHSFKNRIIKRQPLVMPSDVRRYFMSGWEAGQLCLLSCVLGKNTEVFVPKLDDASLFSFPEIAEAFLDDMGYKPHYCSTEQDARENVLVLEKDGYWPCYKTVSNTSGEKEIESFHSSDEQCDVTRYKNVSVITNCPHFNQERVSNSLDALNEFIGLGQWSSEDLIQIITDAVPEFSHLRRENSLDERM